MRCLKKFEVRIFGEPGLGSITLCKQTTSLALFGIILIVLFWREHIMHITASTLHRLCDPILLVSLTSLARVHSEVQW